MAWEAATSIQRITLSLHNCRKFKKYNSFLSHRIKKHVPADIKMHKMKTSFVSPEMPQAHGLTKLALIVEFYIRIKLNIIRYIFFQ